jgi:hypothetical protein
MKGKKNDIGFFLNCFAKKIDMDSFFLETLFGVSDIPLLATKRETPKFILKKEVGRWLWGPATATWRVAATYVSALGAGRQAVQAAQGVGR